MSRPMQVSPPRATTSKDRYSFSLYESDRAIIADVIAALDKRGLAIQRTQFVRGLLHFTSEDDLLVAAVEQHGEDLLKSGPREKENVAERFTVENLREDAAKVGRVVARLKAKGIKMNDSYVLRSQLRRLPPDEALVPLFQDYLTRFPDGRTRSERTRRGRRKRG